MHSPLNCLPGAGWLPMSSGRLAIPVHGGRRRGLQPADPAFHD